MLQERLRYQQFETHIIVHEVSISYVQLWTSSSL